nr:E2 protein [Equus caballus papillomavirus 2]UXM19324.1 E2 protein [Equus caballus papillomavirus 2]UXM19330.1 E2 protein [Equus caballus papillomavirus 2]
MENLHRALDALAERQMTLYERGSTNLVDHLDLWFCQRKENVMLHAARKHGVQRVGCLPVPSLATSAAKAKGAIGMTLLIESLLKSPFAGEPWSMTDVSREMYAAPPCDTFKKGGYVVEVLFSQDSHDAMWYTGWQHVYYQGSDGQWLKTPGGVDSRGLFFDREGTRDYYVDFQKESNKYGTGGHWVVKVGSQTLSSPVVTSTTGDCGEPAAPPGSGGRGSATGASHAPVSSAGPADNGCGHLADADGVPSQSPRCVSHSHRNSPDGGRKRKAEPSHPRARGPGLLGTPPSPALLQGEDAPDSSHSSQTRPPHHAETEGPAGKSGVVVRRDVSVGGSSFLVLTGRAPQLKCLRYRLKKSHSKKFCEVTTTFFLTRSSGKERAGQAKILLTFDSPGQCSSFWRDFPLPPGVTAQPCFG